MTTLEDTELAILFHDTYERLAPSFGYETRDDTKVFDQTSKNGKLMVAVAHEINQAITLHTQEAEIALARKVLGVSSMVHKQKGITQSMRLKHLTKEMLKIIPDTFGLIEDHLTNPTEAGEK